MSAVLAQAPLTASAAFTETTIRFGEGGGLVGTLCVPCGGTAPLTSALLLTNAGVVSRIGPNRLNVRLARRAAAQGVPSLRFDLSGLGDSRAATGTLGYEAQALLDLRTAIDELERRFGIRRHAMAGLCSGADHAYRLAAVEPRVAAVMMIDPWGYPSRLFPVRRVLARLRQYGAGGVVARLRQIWGERHRNGVLEQLEAGNPRVGPPHREFVDTLCGAAQRGVSISLVYTNGNMRRGDFLDQFRGSADAKRLGAHVQRMFLEDTDHTVSEQAAQRQLLDGFDAWLRTAFDGAAGR